MALTALLFHLAAVCLVATAQSTSSSSSTSISNSAGSSNSSSVTPTQTSSAQFPSLSGYPSCVANCFTLSIAAANCTSVVDVDCFCTEKNGTRLFTDEMVACIDEKCSDQLGSAETLAQKFCAVASSSVSLSFPRTATTTPVPIPSEPSSSSEMSGSPSATSPGSSASPSPSDGSAGSQLLPLQSTPPLHGIALVLAFILGPAVI